MVSANQLMVADDVTAVLQTLANSKAGLLHKPFVISKFVPQREVNDRGPYDPSKTYNFGDQVSYGNNYLFIARANGVTAAPLDPVTNDPSFGWVQPWESCYQRLRDALHESILDLTNGVTIFDTMVSGPWPCQYPDIFYRNVEFYFADTGHTEFVYLRGDSPPTNQAGALGTFTTQRTLLPFRSTNGTTRYEFPSVEADLPGGAFTDTPITGPDDENFDSQALFQYLATSEIKIAIGGTQPVNVNGTFTIDCTAFLGLKFREFATVGGDFDIALESDFADPSGFIQVDAGDFLPGASFVASWNGWGGSGYQPGSSTFIGSSGIELKCTVNGTFNPGIYTVRLSSTRAPNNRVSGMLTFDGALWHGESDWQFDTFAEVSTFMSFAGTCGWSSSLAVEVPGVHDTKKVFKIAAPPYNPSSGLPPGLWFGDAYYKLVDTSSGTNLGKPFSGFRPGFGQILKSSVDGYIVSPNTSTTIAEFVKLAFDIHMNMAYSASTTGFWKAITPPVQSLGLCPFDRMPWNIFPVLAVGAVGNAAVNKFLGYKPPYLNGLTGGLPATPAYADDGPAWITESTSNELLPWPKRWKSGVFYPTGYTIMDSNGNLQISTAGRSGGLGHEPNWATGEGSLTAEPNVGAETGVHWKLYKALSHAPTIQRSLAYSLGAVGWDDNGNKQIVTVAGTTGNSSPSLHWSKSVGGLTGDGTVTWKLIYLGTIAPAVAKITPPTYPFFWQNPPAGQTDPPPILSNNVTDGRGNQLYDFAPQGWWIYRVAINRIPQTKTTDKPSAVPIPVKIGCIRNGAFVSFGTFNSGQIINAYWPVFTNTALCYQASERVDIQAAIITCGTNYQKWGHVDFPFAATYLNDVETLLHKLT